MELNDADQVHNSLPEVLLLNLSGRIFSRLFLKFLFPSIKTLLHYVQNSITTAAAEESSSTKCQQYTELRNSVSQSIKSAFEHVRIFVGDTVEECDDVVRTFMLNGSTRFIGLDCEWVSSTTDGVALVQISTGTECLLYRMPTDGVGSVSECLRTLLEDQKVLKFGVAIDEDVRRLRSHGINAYGFVDLRSVADRCLPRDFKLNSSANVEKKFQGNGLRALSFKTLDMKLDKSFDVQCSNWEIETYTEKQTLYAAKDAIVSLEIFFALILIRKWTNADNFLEFGAEKLQTQKSIICCKNQHCYSHATDSLVPVVADENERVMVRPDSLFVEKACSLCQGIIDLKYKNKRASKRNTKGVVRGGGGQKQKVPKQPCRNKPLYDNCFLLAPDGTLLATINQNKADWYLKRDIAILESESPYTVRLKFEPSGKVSSESEYYTRTKENVCVVCGGEESFVRKMVVPHDYKKHFPKKLKGHTSHDVLLLCLRCHSVSQRCDEKLRQNLAVKYNAPLGTKERVRFIDNPILGKVRSASKALKYGADKIPEPRHSHLEQILKEYFKTENVDSELLEKALLIETKVENKDFTGSHSEKVIKGVVDESGGVNAFIRMWRIHFLETMKPQHLPDLWSVDHNLSN